MSLHFSGSSSSCTALLKDSHWSAFMSDTRVTSQLPVCDVANIQDKTMKGTLKPLENLDSICIYVKLFFCCKPFFFLYSCHAWGQRASSSDSRKKPRQCPGARSHPAGRRAAEKVGIDWRSRNGDYLGSADQKRHAQTVPAVLADTNSPLPASTNTC